MPATISVAELSGTLSQASVSGSLHGAAIGGALAAAAVTGTVAGAAIGGSLSPASVSGSVAVQSGYPTYTGATTVVPRANAQTVLQTAARLMPSDVTVLEVPYYETSNPHGMTVYIAQEV